MLRVLVPDIATYDTFYKRLIRRVDLFDVRTIFVMEELKSTTAVPLDYAFGDPTPGTRQSLSGGRPPRHRRWPARGPWASPETQSWESRRQPTPRRSP